MHATLTDAGGRSSQTSVRGSLAILLGGSLIGQIMAAASTPIITRIYHPERLGQVAIFSAVLTAGAVVSTLGFEKAVPLPTDDGDADRLIGLALRLAVPISIAITVFSMIVFPELDGPAIGALLFGGLVAVAVFNVGLAHAIRGNRMPEIGRTRAAQGVGQAAIQVVGGFATRGGFVALGLGIVAARCFGAVSLLRGWRPIRARNASDQAGRVGADRRRLAQRYRAFAIFSMPGSLANSLSLLLPPMLIAITYGVERGGLFTISSRLAMLPAIVVSGALTPAYIERITRHRRSNPTGDHPRSSDGRRVFVAFTASLLAVGCVAAAIVAVCAPWAGGLLGSDWAAVGPDLRRLLPVVLLQPAASTISQTLNAVEKNRAQFVWELARLVAIAGTILGCHRLGYSALTAVTGVGLVLAASYLAVMALSWRALAPQPAESVR